MASPKIWEDFLFLRRRLPTDNVIHFGFLRQLRRPIPTYSPSIFGADIDRIDR